VRNEAPEAQMKICMALVVNSGAILMTTTPMRNIPMPRTFYGDKSAQEIDNFL